MPDEHLLDLLATDLTAHFEQLVVGYWSRLYTFAFRYTGNAERAEDAVQETFIRAYTTLQNYPAQRIRTLKVLPWLYKICLYVHYGSLRATKLQEVSLESENSSALEVLADDWRNQPELVAESKEWVSQLGVVIAQLPLHFREAIILYYFEEMSYREIVEVLNIPLGTVKSNLHRGTRLLRRALQTQEHEVEKSYE